MTPPETLDWDLFVGPAPMRPYHEIYTPWNWRDGGILARALRVICACHVLDPVYQALKLGYPTKSAEVRPRLILSPPTGRNGGVFISCAKEDVQSPYAAREGLLVRRRSLAELFRPCAGR